jgi:hypothetical protein
VHECEGEGEGDANGHSKDLATRAHTHRINRFTSLSVDVCPVRERNRPKRMNPVRSKSTRTVVPSWNGSERPQSATRS